MPGGGENNLEARPCFAAPEKVKVSLSVEAQKSFNRLKKQMKIETGIKAEEKAMEMMLKKLEEYLENEVVRGTVRTGRAAAVDQEKQTRYVSAAKKREVYKRSEKICEYPGCTKAIENLHHRERFAKSQSHKTLTALCKAHHEIVHNGFAEMS